MGHYQPDDLTFKKKYLVIPQHWILPRQQTEQFISLDPLTVLYVYFKCYKLKLRHLNGIFSEIRYLKIFVIIL